MIKYERGMSKVSHKMTRTDLRNNLRLSSDFTKFSIENPGKIRRVPKNACIVISSKKHPALSKKNARLGIEVMKKRKVRCYKAVSEKGSWKLVEMKSRKRSYSKSKGKK